MSIPSYQKILDSEIDPESPITSSLMFRMRDNWLALLGIDKDDDTPVFRLPPSCLASDAQSVSASGANTTWSSAEIILSAVVDGAEFADNPYIHLWNTATPWGADLLVDRLEVIYSSGAPVSVEIDWREGFSTTGTRHTSSFPIDNAYHGIGSGFGSPSGNFGGLSLKARADSDNVYLALQATTFSGATYHAIMGWNRRFFKDKSSA